MLFIIRLSLALLVIAIPAIGQDQKFTLRVDVPVVSLDVSVTDEHGQPVEGLAPEDFQVYENGTLQDIEYFGSSAAPYHVYLLFDGSGSTRHKWDFMRSAVSGFVGYLEPQDRVRVGIFGGRLRDLTDWDAPREEVLRALDPFMATNGSSGTTALYDSLERVLNDSFDKIRERRAVIVLTDGRDTSMYRETVRRNRVRDSDENRDFRNLRKKAEEKGIPVYFVAFNTDRNLEHNFLGADEYRNLMIIYRDSPIPQRYLEQVRLRMELVSEASGGQVRFPSRFEDVIPLYEQIGREFGGAYSLGYVPQPGTPGEGLRRIEVRVPGGQYRITQSRAGYYP